MPFASGKLKSFLDQNGVRYEIIPHDRDYTAQETAAHTHTPGREFAKTVVLNVDGAYALAVLPAPHRVALEKLGQALGAKQVRLASEREIEKICPECEAGAVPPFGNLFGMTVYVSPALAEDETITFNAGTHEEVVRLPYRDFERLARPRVIDLSP